MLNVDSQKLAAAVDALLECTAHLTTADMGLKIKGIDRESNKDLAEYLVLGALMALSQTHIKPANVTFMTFGTANAA